MNRCPHCRKQIEVSLTAGSHSKTISGSPRPGEATLYSSYRSPFRNDAAALPLPTSYEAEHRSASFMPTTESNVKVPLLQSLITGAFIGIPVGALAAWVGVAHGPLTIWGGLWTALTWGGVVTFGVAFFQWTTRSRDYNELLWRIESITGLDVTGDEVVGPPPRTVEVKVMEGKSWKFSELPGDEQALYDFAISVVNGIVTFSERGAAATDYGVENFRRLREVFIQRHYAEWKDPDNHQLGVVLRRSGTAVLAAIAKEPPPVEVAESDEPVGMSGNYIERGGKRESWS